jgi:serine/threonine-protein kinase
MAAPDRIGRYRILGEVGQGAMGTVYRGRDEALDRDVAVKVMSRGLADTGARERFQKEARAAARLQHPNIVVIYELGEHEGVPFMALEFLEGVDLQRAIDRGIRPDPRATLPVVLQLLAGLGHAHEHGIVHRDVKPSNVFLPVGRPAKIMDFGVARLAGLGTTTTGVAVGTPNYMSPEQVKAGEVDGRSDLFSAGLILYELVTGEKAYEADSVVSIMYKILHETPNLSLIPEGGQWAGLRGVLERALARNADDRYPDARAMSTDLGEALLDLGGTLDWTAPADQALLVRPKADRTAPVVAGLAPVSASTLPVTAARRRSALRAGLGGVALAAAVATGGWLWLRHRPGATPGSPPQGSPHVPTAADVPNRTPAASPTLAGGPAPSSRPSLPPSPSTPSPAISPSPTTPPAATPPTAMPGLDVEARLSRADDLVRQGHWAEALAEARAVLDTQPTHSRAAALAQQAEAELVIDECLRNARAALRDGDQERALAEVRRGFLVRRDDPRLLAMHREVVALR